MEDTVPDGYDAAKVMNIVDGTEAAPGRGNNRYANFLRRRDRPLAIIVLSVEPSLLYFWRPGNCVGEAGKPISEEENMGQQAYSFLFASENCESTQEHIKVMTEIFDDLSVIEDPCQFQKKIVLCIF